MERANTIPLRCARSERPLASLKIDGRHIARVASGAAASAAIKRVFHSLAILTPVFTPDQDRTASTKPSTARIRATPPASLFPQSHGESDRQECLGTDERIDARIENIDLEPHLFADMTDRDRIVAHS
ncbi:hypothetical protein GCM10011390_20500 [Aureimonas endophytica]|uniref:Uncharacterized protein n=1 Tax=Aureimonas endophytica TaxID=2027858 RepID=A0A917E3J4_9HYPH|nr:hypothetical protein GCM10011390_20500 [Aureimonas endophytica]